MVELEKNGKGINLAGSQQGMSWNDPYEPSVVASFKGIRRFSPTRSPNTRTRSFPIAPASNPYPTSSNSQAPEVPTSTFRAGIGPDRSLGLFLAKRGLSDLDVS